MSVVSHEALPALDPLRGDLADEVLASRRSLVARASDELGLASDSAPMAGNDGAEILASYLARRIWRFHPEPDRSRIARHIRAQVLGYSHQEPACILCTPSEYRVFCLRAGGPARGHRVVQRQTERYERSAVDNGYPPRGIKLVDVTAPLTTDVSVALGMLAQVDWWNRRRPAAVEQIALFSSPHIIGFSSAALPGVIYLNVDLSLQQLIDRIAHETTHLQLFDVLDVVSLTTASPQVRVPSPLRQDLRPVLGVMHAAVVQCRVALTAKRIEEATSITNPNLTRYWDQALDGAATLLEHGRLTPAGHAIVRRIVALGEAER